MWTGGWNYISLFGVLTESELIFCLAWLILASSSYYFTYSVSLPPLCQNWNNLNLSYTWSRTHLKSDFQFPDRSLIPALSISTESSQSQSCNRRDQAGRAHFVGDCRHSHANTFDFDVLVSTGKSENLLHSSQHSTGMWIPPGDLGTRLGACPALTEDPGQSCCRAGMVPGHTSGWKQRAFHYSQCAFPLPFLFLCCSH